MPLSGLPFVLARIHETFRGTARNFIPILWTGRDDQAVAWGREPVTRIVMMLAGEIEG